LDFGIQWAGSTIGGVTASLTQSRLSTFMRATSRASPKLAWKAGYERMTMYLLFRIHKPRLRKSHD
jgi:hypothetical protein